MASCMLDPARCEYGRESRAPELGVQIRGVLSCAAGRNFCQELFVSSCHVVSQCCDCARTAQHGFFKTQARPPQPVNAGVLRTSAVHRIVPEEMPSGRKCAFCPALACAGCAVLCFTNPCRSSASVELLRRRANTPLRREGGACIKPPLPVTSRPI